jgi:hypothetical protein
VHDIATDAVHGGASASMREQNELPRMGLPRKPT